MPCRRKEDKFLAGALIGIGAILSYGAYKMLSGRELPDKRSVIER